MKLLISTTALFLSMTAGAYAADGKLYPATLCQHWTDAGNAPLSAMGISQFGKIVNLSDDNATGSSGGQNLSIVCPIIRDSMRGGGIERVRIYGNHGNCAVQPGNQCDTQTRCRLRIMSETARIERPGSGTKQFVRRNENLSVIQYSLTPNARIEVDFTSINVPSFTNSSVIEGGSIYVLYCQLAPQAELTAIYVGEAT